VQGLKNTLSLPKLNSAYADRPASWPGRSPKGDRDRAPTDFFGRVADGPASWPGRYTDHRVDILRFYKRFCILKNKALLDLMQMQPFMLYEALSLYRSSLLTPLNSMTVYPINPINFFSKHLLTDKNITYILPLPSLDPQSMVISLKDFTISCGPILHYYFSKNC
jgi:hypothetical protein